MFHCDSLPRVASNASELFDSEERDDWQQKPLETAAPAATQSKHLLVGTPKERAKWIRDHKLMAKLRHEHIDVELLFGNPEDLPKPSLRELVLEVLHSSAGQIILALLIVFDSLLIVGEIIVEVKFLTAKVDYHNTEVVWLENYLVDNDARMRQLWHEPRVSAANGRIFIEFLRSIGHNLSSTAAGQSSQSAALATQLATSLPPATHNLTAYLNELEAVLSSREHEMHSLEGIKHLVHITSVVILSVFIGEITLKMLCMRLEFFTSKLELLDGAIIWASFLVDIITLIGNTDSPEASVMIVLLIWRIVRLVNGFLIQEKQRSEAQTEILKQVHQLTLREVNYLRKHQVANVEFIHRLKVACGKLGMADVEAEALRPEVIVSGGDAEANTIGKRSKKISLNLKILSHVSRLSLRKNSSRTRIAKNEVANDPNGACVLSEVVIDEDADTDANASAKVNSNGNSTAE